MGKKKDGTVYDRTILHKAGKRESKKDIKQEPEMIELKKMIKAGELDLQRTVKAFDVKGN